MSAVMKCLLRGCYLWLLDWMMLLCCPLRQLDPCINRGHSIASTRCGCDGPRWRRKRRSMQQSTVQKCREKNASFIIFKELHDALITVKKNNSFPQMSLCKRTVKCKIRRQDSFCYSSVVFQLRENSKALKNRSTLPSLPSDLHTVGAKTLDFIRLEGGVTCGWLYFKHEAGPRYLQ